LSVWRPELILAADWSASSTIGPRAPAPDRCWISWSTPEHAPQPEYFPTRGACTERVLALLGAHAGAAFVGFDFPIGYPTGVSGERVLPSGRDLVVRIASMIVDRHDATNNRFQVAAALNDEIRTRTGAPSGPFWGRPGRLDLDALPFKKPRATLVNERRTIEDHLRVRGVHAKSPWQLMGAGAAGGQTLLGLPAIGSILDAFPGRAVLWPFERPGRRGSVVVAEVYPSIFDDGAPNHPIKDARQVEATRDALRRIWSSGADPLAAPGCAACEGWMAGVQPPESSESQSV